MVTYPMVASSPCTSGIGRPVEVCQVFSRYLNKFKCPRCECECAVANTECDGQLLEKFKVVSILLISVFQVNFY
jgi:hypothetical protein